MDSIAISIRSIIYYIGRVECSSSSSSISQLSIYYFKDPTETSYEF